MLLIDAHLDLAMNALNWDRNLDLGVYEIREKENGYRQEGEGHPIRPRIGNGAPGPSKPGLLPKDDMAGKPYGNHDEEDMEDVNQDRKDGVLSHILIDG